jgi:hypothetical protein
MSDIEILSRTQRIVPLTQVQLVLVDYKVRLDLPVYRVLQVLLE